MSEAATARQIVSQAGLEVGIDFGVVGTLSMLIILGQTILSIKPQKMSSNNAQVAS